MSALKTKRVKSIFFLILISFEKTLKMLKIMQIHQKYFFYCFVFLNKYEKNDQNRVMIVVPLFTILMA